MPLKNFVAAGEHEAVEAGQKEIGTKENGKELKTRGKERTAAGWEAKSQRDKEKQQGKKNRKGEKILL